MQEVKVIGKQEALGIGKPDFTREVFRAKQLFGYELEHGEELLWLTIICMDNPGPSAITRAPLAVGETVYAIDFATGNEEAAIPAGWDYLWKEVWIGFDQDIEWEMFQGGTFNDVSCRATIAAGSNPPNFMQTGCTRSLIEDITVPSVLRCKIKNVGGAPAKGKVWLVCIKKEGLYYWR